MKNKHISMILLLAVVLLSTGCNNTTVSKINNSTEISDNTFTEEEISKDEYVDTKIAEITASEEYKESSYDDRKTTIEQILTDLKREKYKKNVYYDKDNQMFTFQYSSGVLGGVMIKEFDSLTN